MSLTVTQLLSTATPADFVTRLKFVAAAVGLVPSSWRAGGIVDTLIGAFGNLLGAAAGSALDSALAAKALDGLATTVCASGFLDEAAKVTPDPPTLGSDGTFSGWLDLLADSLVDVRRTAATKATGSVVLTNAAAQARGPFASGAYHVANAVKKTTYANAAELTLAAAGDTTATFVADVAGSGSTTAAAALTPVTSLVGVSIDPAKNTATLTGADAQTNASLVAACRAKLQSFGPKLGPAGAYVYFATTPTEPGYPTLSQAVTRAVVSTSALTGVVSVYLAYASAPAGAGDVALLSTYLGLVAVPDGVTAQVLAATQVSVSVVLTAYVPTANAATAVADIRNALTSHINALPIGGAAGGGVAAKGVQYSAVLAAIFAQVSYVQNVTGLLLNGAATDAVLAASEIAVQTPAATVTLVLT